MEGEAPNTFKESSKEDFPYFKILFINMELIHFIEIIAGMLLTGYTFFLNYQKKELERLKDEVDKHVNTKIAELKMSNDRKDQRHHFHSKSIFTRIGQLELNVGLLALQHQHLESSGEWVKDPSNKAYVIDPEAFKKKQIIKENETKPLIR